MPLQEPGIEKERNNPAQAVPADENGNKSLRNETFRVMAFRGKPFLQYESARFILLGTDHGQLGGNDSVVVRYRAGILYPVQLQKSHNDDAVRRGETSETADSQAVQIPDFQLVEGGVERKDKSSQGKQERLPERGPYQDASESFMPGGLKTLGKKIMGGHN